MAKPPSQNGKSLPKPGRRLATRQVLDMQQAMYKTALLLEKDALECSDREERARVASALANLAKGWDALENRKRILRGKPLPGSLRPEKVKAKGRSPDCFVEPLRPEDAAHSEPAERDEVKLEMREVRPGMWQQVVIDSPAVLRELATPPAAIAQERPKTTSPLNREPLSVSHVALAELQSGVWPVKTGPMTRTEAAEQHAQALLNHQAIQRRRQRHGLA